jgi:hypothetical protein
VTSYVRSLSDATLLVLGGVVLLGTGMHVSHRGVGLVLIVLGVGLVGMAVPAAIIRIRKARRKL